MLINFTTPYLYTPGESLVLYIAHTGYTPSTEPNPFFAVASFANGVADAVSSTVGYQAAVPGGFFPLHRAILGYTSSRNRLQLLWLASLALVFSFDESDGGL